MLCCLLFLLGTAQEQLIPILKNYTTEEGLPSSQVYQIKQDKRGYMWFATDNGVSRFDGNEFKNFTEQDGLCVKTLFGLYEDDEDRIWFYSYSGKLIYFDYADEKIHCPTFNNQLSSLVTGKLINGLVKNKDTLIAFDYKGTLFKIDLTKNSIHVEPASEGLKLNVHSNGAISYGVYKTTTTKDSLFPFRFQRITNQQQTQFHTSIHLHSSWGRISSGLVLDSANYLVSTEDFLFQINATTNSLKSTQLTHSNTQSLYKDQQGLIWMGSYHQGVYAYELGKFDKPVYHFLSDYLITNILQDNAGGYWFSTQDNGVFYTPYLEARQIDKDITNTIKALRLFNIDTNLFYFNRIGDLLSLNTGTFKTKQLFTNNFRIGIESLHQLEDGFFFQTFNKKVYYYQAEQLDDVTFEGSIYDVLALESDTFFMVFEEGHLVVKKGPLPELKTVYKGNSPPTMYFDGLLMKSKDLYYVHSSTLYFLKAFTNTPIKIDQFSNVASITKCINDSIWASSRTDGVALIHKGSILKQFTTRNGLPFNHYKHISCDGDNLFLSSNLGVTRIANAFSDSTYISTINKNHGLLSDEINNCTRIKDQLFIATRKGLSIIDTNIFNKKAYPLVCKIDSCSYPKNAKNSESKPLSLPYDFDFLQIHFSAISFANAFNIPFRYRLNQSKKWIYTKRKEASYSNLSPGDYQFEVQAAGIDNKWGESTQFSFTVAQPFWNEPLFIVGCILLFLFIVFLVYNNKIKNLKRINHLKTSLIHNQNIAMSSQMNPHFIFNSLNSISNTIIKNDVKSSISFIGKLGKLMRMVFENSQETFISLDEELTALTTYLEIEQIRLKEKLSFSIHTDASIEKEATFIPALLLQPFVENAIWHGIAPKEGNGTVRVSISKEHDNLVIEIKDDGIGVKDDSPSPREKSGIRTTGKRIELIRKIFKRDISFSITALKQDSKTIGTKVLLIIPVIEEKPNTGISPFDNYTK